MTFFILSTTPSIEELNKINDDKISKHVLLLFLHNLNKFFFKRYEKQEHDCLLLLLIYLFIRAKAKYVFLNLSIGISKYRNEHKLRNICYCYQNKLLHFRNLINRKRLVCHKNNLNNFWYIQKKR